MSVFKSDVNGDGGFSYGFNIPHHVFQQAPGFLRWGQLKRTPLRLRGIMTGRQFHANMKVQTSTCRDNSNSRSRAATYVKFKINIK